MAYYAYKEDNDAENCSSLIFCTECILTIGNCCSNIKNYFKNFNKNDNVHTGTFKSNSSISNLSPIHPPAYSPYKSTTLASYQYLPEPNKIDLINSQTSLTCMESEIIS